MTDRQATHDGRPALVGQLHAHWNGHYYEFCPYGPNCDRPSCHGQDEATWPVPPDLERELAEAQADFDRAIAALREAWDGHAQADFDAAIAALPRPGEPRLHSPRVDPRTGRVFDLDDRAET